MSCAVSMTCRAPWGLSALLAGLAALNPALIPHLAGTASPTVEGTAQAIGAGGDEAKQPETDFVRDDPQWLAEAGGDDGRLRGDARGGALGAGPPR